MAAGRCSTAAISTLSCSVKAYFALKAAGDESGRAAYGSARARRSSRAGGAAHANVFTRIQLALFGELPWHAVPVMPVEIMLLPRWFPFHLTKVSYWSRTVIVPLLVLMAKKPRARNPRGIDVHELFAPGTQAKPPRARGSIWATVFNLVDDVLRAAEPLIAQARAPARDRRGGRLRHRAPQWRGRARRHLSGDGQHGDDVRLPRLSRRAIRASSIARAALEKLLVLQAGPRLCASPASRRSGIPGLPRMR